MNAPNAITPTCAQAHVKDITVLQQHAGTELQVKRLRRLFGFPPEVARTIASLAFAAEARP
jgi:hypothetical protein